MHSVFTRILYLIVDLCVLFILQTIFFWNYSLGFVPHKQFTLAVYGPAMCISLLHVTFVVTC